MVQQQQQQQQQQQAPSTPTQQTVQAQPLMQSPQPQVITLQQLQNFFPQQAQQAQQIHQLNAADAAQLQAQVQAFQNAAAQSPQHNSQQNQQTQLKSLYSSPTQPQQVINLPQQYIQLKNDQPQQQIIQIKQPDGSITQQIIQLKPEQMQHQQPMQQVISAQGGQIIQGPNGMFQIVQPMQTVTVDGQEALFIPNQLGNAQAVQIGGQQAYITPSGQIVRAPVMTPGNFLQNMPQTMQLPNGKKKDLFLLYSCMYGLRTNFITITGPLWCFVSGLKSNKFLPSFSNTNPKSFT